MANAEGLKATSSDQSLDWSYSIEPIKLPHIAWRGSYVVSNMADAAEDEKLEAARKRLTAARKKVSN
jgi:hypothetical protein